MTALELINILSGCYPSENVTVQSEAGRNMQVLGIDADASREAGCIVLKTAWSYMDKPVESEEDKLRRQREDITKQLARMKAEERKVKEKAEKEAVKKKTTRKKKRKTTSKARGATKMVAEGKVPTGKPGRPRKMVADAEFLQDLATVHDLDTLGKELSKKKASMPMDVPSE